MLNRAAVLIVEDEPFIALDLGFAVEDAGGQVVGPAATVKHALRLFEAHVVAAAILDVNLDDADIVPVVEYLVEHDIPMILQTGMGLPEHLAARFPDLIVRIKPNVAAELVAELEALLAGRQQK